MRILLIFLLFTALVREVPGEGSQPNVLIIIADDLGMGDLSANGNREVKTPNLDKLADSGLKFSKFYVCPNGSSTLASLLTGRYHYRTGVVGESGPEAMMYGSEKTLGDCFSENGYRTAWFGKWHHGDNWPQNAKGQGFQIFEPATAAVEFLSSEDKAPFFCMVMLDTPALPDANDIPEENRLAEVYRRIEATDKSVGELRAAADENTIVIFLSDNGPDQFGKTEGRYNSYFYGGKGSVHEGGVRVPCFIAWPGKIEPGSRFTRIAAHIDIYPTLLQLCELESKSRQLGIDGSSLASVLLDAGNSENWPNRILFTSWTPPGYDIKNASVAVRSDRWVALRDPRWRRDPGVMESSNGWELYDLKTDPFESIDRGKELPYLLSDLKADFAFWMDHTTDDGIGPISTHIGYQEWPVVTLKPRQNRKWPVNIISEGNYTFAADLAEGCQSCEILAGDDVVKIPGKTEVHLTDNVTELVLQKGEISELRISKSNTN